MLGRGAFASVYRAKCDELPCAAKILHTIFSAHVQTVEARFFQEFEFLKSIHHPNIVQCLGLCQEPTTNRPALLMELMDQSLTNFLESSTVPLSHGVQFRLCHDISLAIAYLHSLKIIHRALSSNNVLLLGPGVKAKVSDFGMSRMIGITEHKYTTPLTMATGTTAYIPQEALGENPKYSEKLDVFSFGVLVIEIMTRCFPDPSPRKKEVVSPSGTIIVPVEETECRKDHISMIDKTNPLLDIAIECLSLKMENRPSAKKICHVIEVLKKSEFDEPDNGSSSVPEWKERELHLEAEIIGLKIRLQAFERLPQPPSRRLSITNWRSGSPAPDLIAKSSSTAMFNSSMVCCSQHAVWDYDVSTDSWKDLPKLCTKDLSGVLIVFHKELGKLFAVKNSIVYVLHNEWVAKGRLEFSPWSVLYHEKLLLFFGPRGQFLSIQYSSDADPGHVHSSLTISPSLDYASVIVCNGAVYMMGVCKKKGWRFFKYSLEGYLCSKNTFSWFDFSTFNKGAKKVSWLEIAPLPVTQSTFFSFRDHLLAVGGFAKRSISGDIFLYDEEQDKWDVIGRIPTPRYDSQAEVVGDQLVVVGGSLNRFEECNIVEIVTINVHASFIKS